MSKAFVGEKLHHSFYRPTFMHCVKGMTAGRIGTGSLFEPVEKKNTTGRMFVPCYDCYICKQFMPE